MSDAPKSQRPETSEDPWRQLVLAVARALWIDRFAEWLASTRLVRWMGTWPAWTDTAVKAAWRVMIAGWLLLPVVVLIVWLLQGRPS